MRGSGTTANLINWLPLKELGNKVIVKVLSKFFPNFHGSSKIPPKVFRCVPFVFIHAQSHYKLDPQALKYVFIGYSQQRRGTNIITDHPTSKKFFISMGVTFAENQTFFIDPHLQRESSILI